MFQFVLAEIIQAEREREIAELIRQRRLLKPDAGGQDPDEPTGRRAEARTRRVRAQTARG